MLVLLNVPVWFHTLPVRHEVISWLLLIASVIPLVLGLRSLRLAGRAEERREATLLEFEETAELIATASTGTSATH